MSREFSEDITENQSNNKWKTEKTEKRNNVNFFFVNYF